MKHSCLNQVQNQVSSTFRLFLLFGGLLVQVLTPALVSAAVGLDGSSRSYLQIRESESGSHFLPGYEYFNFSVGNEEQEGLSAHFGGWIRYDFNQETSQNDVQYAYLDYRRKYDNGILRLGRVMVFDGVAQAERVDGAYARTDILGPALGVSAFGGVPAEIGNDTAGNNVIYGARLSHRWENLYELGISGLKEEKNNTDFRRDIGADLWVKPAGKIELLGKSFYDDVAGAWAEHAYTLVLGPFHALRSNTEVRRYDYGAYLRTASAAAFAFGDGLLDKDEKVTSVGEELSYALSDTVTFSGKIALHDYQLAGNAVAYGAKINYSREKKNAAGASVLRMAGDDDRLKYTQFRLYGTRMIGKTTLAADLIDVLYDRDVGGGDNSFSAVLAATYDLSRSLKVGADVQYLDSPLFSNDVTALAKVIYVFGSKIGGGWL